MVFPFDIGVLNVFPLYFKVNNTLQLIFVPTPTFGHPSLLVGRGWGKVKYFKKLSSAINDTKIS